MRWLDRLQFWLLDRGYPFAVKPAASGAALVLAATLVLGWRYPNAPDRGLGSLIFSMAFFAIAGGFAAGMIRWFFRFRPTFSLRERSRWPLAILTGLALTAIWPFDERQISYQLIPLMMGVFFGYHGLNLLFGAIAHSRNRMQGGQERDEK